SYFRDRRGYTLATDDLDFSGSHWPGEPRLAAGKDRRQRHSKRRREMKNAGVDTNHEGGSSNEPCHGVDQPAIGNAAMRKLRHDAFAARAFGVIAPRKQKTR